MNKYSVAYKSPPFVGISGIIGSGKTTLTKLLSETLGWRCALEPVKTNPYLSPFYDDMRKYAFNMQIFLLNKRFSQHQSIVWNKRPTVQDRTIYEDPIFALMLAEKNIISDLDFQTYADCFDNMTNFLHKPDLIVYLDVDPDVALKRIASRGRVCEKSISLEYLTELKNGYDQWLNTGVKGINVLKLDWNHPVSVKDIILKINDFVDVNYVDTDNVINTE